MITETLSYGIYVHFLSFIFTITRQFCMEFVKTLSLLFLPQSTTCQCKDTPMECVWVPLVQKHLILVNLDYIYIFSNKNLP